MEQNNLIGDFPKKWKICYTRTATQFDDILKKWIKKTFYIRAKKGKRNYGNISNYDWLLLAGVFNHKTQKYEEFAYNDGDQEAMFMLVFDNFIKLNERNRLQKQLQKLLEKTKNHTLSTSKPPIVT